MLPVQSVYSELVDHLKNHPVVLLQAPPGAGKSTWLPLQLLKEKTFGKIVMLQPRRIAARNIAQYLAECLNEKVGQSVGLRIKQEKIVGPNTRLEIVTEGMLTRMLQTDPELNGVDLLIFDEFHERSIAADTSLAFALESQQALRDDLTLLIMSATIDADKIQKQFSCPVVSTLGRMFSVEEHYHPLKREADWLEEMLKLIPKVMTEQSGSALVFLPGQKEIRFINDRLSFSDSSIELVTLHGDQSREQQQRAIAASPFGARKCVLTTNVAETSLTIEGIRIVIDSGKKRGAFFNLKSGVTELKTVNISRASAIQRAGRAGRLEPGVVFRLGGREHFERRAAQDSPEVLTQDISDLVLQALVWGTEPEQLILLDPPSAAQIKQAKQLLIMLEALSVAGRPTELASEMLKMGTDLRFAHMLVKARMLEPELSGISYLACQLMVLLESKQNNQPDLVRALERQHAHSHRDHKKQLQFWLHRTGNKAEHSGELKTEYLPILLALAFPDRIAKRRGAGYQLANGSGAQLKEGYWEGCEYICIADLGGQQGQTIFSATSCQIDFLVKWLPYLSSWQTRCEFDETLGRFINERQHRLGAICIDKKPSSEPIDKEMKNQAWHQLILKHGLNLFEQYCKDKDCQQLLMRQILASKLYPSQFKNTDEQVLLSELDSWLLPFLSDCNSLKDLRKFDLKSTLKMRFDWQQQCLLDEKFPLKITVPSGSEIKLDYIDDTEVKLSVRMQEVYGWVASPLVADGKLNFTLELLSPARRPLQITRDLAHFWQNAYHEVKKEMKGRYPKHFWPDDPANSPATRTVKSKMP